MVAVSERLLPQKEEVSQRALDKEDDGDAEGELAVLGFVAEKVQSQEGADTAADKLEFTGPL